MTNISHNSFVSNGTEIESPSINLPLFAVLTAILITFTILGNILSLIVICKTPSLWDTSSLLLGNMAVADLIVGIVCMPLVFVSMCIDGNFLPPILCMAAGYFNTVVTGASMQTLALICTDRCIAVLKPLHYHIYMSTNVLKFLIALSWISPIIISALPMLGLQHYGLGYYQYVDYLYMCWLDVIQIQYNRIFLLLVYSLVLLVLACVVISCILILRVIHNLNNTVREITISSSNDRIISKSIRTMMLIVGVFAICLMPAVVVTLVTIITRTSFHTSVYQFILWITYVNSAVNPILYGFSNQEFRHSYKALWKKYLSPFRSSQLAN